MGELKYHTSENASTLPLSVSAAGGGEGASWLAENWARESEGEVSHLGSESESMRRKEAAWLLGGGGCSSCNCLIAARAWVGVGVRVSCEG